MKAYKTEIKLNKEQKDKYKLTISACRFVYNLFISENKLRYEKGLKYLNNYEFSKWFNNNYLPGNSDKKWIKTASSKAIKNTINNCDYAYRKAIKFKKGFPRFKKVSKDKTGFYFVRNSLSYPIKCFKHKIKVPTLGWVTLKEKNYLPIKENQIISGTIIKRAHKYFISVITDENIKYYKSKFTCGLGIDLGIKNLAVLSDNTVYTNINKTKRVKKIEKRLKRQQKALNRKFEIRKKDKNIQSYKNIEKNKLNIEKLYFKLECIRNAYINKVIDDIIRKNPKFIVIEDLNIKGMMKNKYLSKSIQNQKFYYFKQVLIQKATKHNIEIREANRFYPSSKICNICGYKNSNLTLKTREWICPQCKSYHDRDINAAINLKNYQNYKILNTDGLSGINDCGLSDKMLVPNIKKYRENRQDETVKSLKYSNINLERQDLYVRINS